MTPLPLSWLAPTCYRYSAGWRRGFNSPGSHPGDHRFESGPRNHDFLRKEGNTEGTTATGIAVLLSQVTTLATLMGEVWTIMVANPLLAVMLAASLVTVGIRLFKRIKAAAK